MVFHLSAVLLSALVMYHLARAHSPEADTRRRRSSGTRSWLRVVRPFAVISIAASIRAHLSVLILGVLADVESAGLFNAAQRLAGFTSFMLLVVAFPLGPAVARAWVREGQHGVQRLYSLTGVLIAGAAIPTAITIIVLGRQILGLFGPEFVAAYGVLTLLVVRELINAAAGAAGVALPMTGHESVVARASITTALLDLLAGVALIPRAGAEGVAIASIGGTLALNTWLAVSVKRRLNVDPTIASVRRLGRALR